MEQFNAQWGEPMKFHKGFARLFGQIDAWPRKQELAEILGAAGIPQFVAGAPFLGASFVKTLRVWLIYFGPTRGWCGTGFVLDNLLIRLKI